MKRKLLFGLVMALAAPAGAVINITVNTTITSPVTYTDDVVVLPGITLEIKSTTASFTPGHGLTVNRTGRLILNNGSLLRSGLSGTWKGVTLDPLSTNTGAIAFSTLGSANAIKNADIGINSVDPGSGTTYCPSILAGNVTFDRNGQHLVLIYNTTNMNTGLCTISFSTCAFDNSTSSDPIMLDLVTFVTMTSCTFNSAESTCTTQVHVDHAKYMTYDGCTFSSSKLTGLAIHYEISNLTVTACKFVVSSTAKPGSTCDASYSYGCITFCSPSATTNTNVSIKNSNFSVATSGNTFAGIVMPNISTNSVNNLDIRDNYFGNLNTGIRVSSCNGTASIIKGNTFENFSKGIATFDNNTSLGIYCNTFQSPLSAASIGISLESGSLQTAGIPDRRNIFTGSFIHLKNATATSWSYYRSGSPGDPTTTSGLVSLPSTSTDVNCAALRMAGAPEEALPAEGTLSLTLVPNPAHNTVQPLLSKPGTPGEVTVFDLAGKQVLRRMLQPDETLDISALQAGVYLLQVQAGGTVLREKLIVQ